MRTVAMAVFLEVNVTARIVVNEAVYHQLPNTQATSIRTLFDRALDTLEQPLLRSIVVGKEWQPLETYWLKRAGMLVVSNEEGKRFEQIPTADELRKVMSRIVEVCFYTGMPPAFTIRPKESCRFEPFDLSAILLRCPNGPAICTISVYPA